MQPGSLHEDRSAAASGRMLAALLLGYPLWWALGVAAVAPMLVAAVMLRDLLRRPGPLHLPAGALPWLLFLGCVVAGVLLLDSDAPGAVAGGFGAGRLMVFGYRLAWYLTCTIVAVWLVNSSRERLPDRRVHAWIAVLCVVTVCGGLIGMLWPQLEFTSPLELVLPGGLRANSFVATLVHPEVADVQQVLGTAEARPKAPFAYTNTWGSVLALSLAYAVTWALVPAGRVVARIAASLLVVVALVPAVHSLNRGLWACLLLFAVGGCLLALRRGRARTLVAGALVAGLGAALLLGPLVSVVSARMEHQHSNDRRGSLAAATVDSVTTGSPVLGFGSTRDVQGSFTSIAGGSTPDCPACGVPPLGTQGHLWLVLFSQGWLGLALFLSTLACALARCWRCRTPNQTLATFILAAFTLQLFVYDTLGLPLLLVAIAVGLVAREQRDLRPLGAVRTGRQVAERAARAAPLTLVLLVAGGAAGAFLSQPSAAPAWSTRVHVALTLPPDPYSVPAVSALVDEQALERRELRVTLDTEAALLLSEETIARSGTRPDGVSLTAQPNTQILLVTVRAGAPETSRTEALAVVEAYLEARQAYVTERRADLLTKLRSDLRQVLPRDQASQVMISRLTTADARLRATPDEVGRVVEVDPPQALPSRTTLHAASGAALGAMAGVALTAASRRAPEHPHRSGRPRRRRTREEPR